MNDDLISRKAAILQLSHNKCGNEEWDIAVQHDIETITQLSSAQPDGIPLEWIDKHLEWLDNCDNDFAQLAKVSIKAMVEIWKKDKT